MSVKRGCLNTQLMMYAERIIERLLFLSSVSKRAPISKRELKSSLLLIASIVGVIALSSLFLVTQYRFVWPAIIIACLLVAVGYFTASKDVFQCLSCKEVFKIAKLQDFFAPHGITKTSNGQLNEWKLLKCHGCSKRKKCYRVKE